MDELVREWEQHGKKYAHHANKACKYKVSHVTSPGKLSYSGDSRRNIIFCNCRGCLFEAKSPKKLCLQNT